MKPLFIHIPKNAGTSVNISLDEKGLFYPWMEGHFTHSQMQARCRIHNYNPDFTFCIVRNPYKRFISIFHYTISRLKKRKKIFNTEHVHYKSFVNMDFNSFVRYYLASQPTYKMLINYYHFLPQATFLDTNSNITAYKFENLQKLENDLNIELPYVNIGDYDTDLNLYYKNKKTKSIVEEFYRADFEMFDYDMVADF